MAKICQITFGVNAGGTPWPRPSALVSTYSGRAAARQSNMNMTTRLAAALLALGDIPYEDSKLMTAEQIISLYQWDHHPLRRCDFGSDHPSNLRPMLIAAHRAKTTTIDMPAIAKGRRIRARQAQHLERMRSK
jgi:hypothetical protein